MDHLEAASGPNVAEHGLAPLNISELLHDSD